MSINTQAADAIEAGAKLIRAGKWCQDTFARDENGNPTFSMSPTATSWCGLGAVWRCNPGQSREVIKVAEAALGKRIESLYGGRSDFAVFNDGVGRTAEEVAVEMEAAAAALRGRE